MSICNDVKCRVDEEPGPAGDVLISMVTNTRENQFLEQKVSDRLHQCKGTEKTVISSRIPLLLKNREFYE